MAARYPFESICETPLDLYKSMVVFSPERPLALKDFNRQFLHCRSAKNYRRPSCRLQTDPFNHMALPSWQRFSLSRQGKRMCPAGCFYTSAGHKFILWLQLPVLLAARYRHRPAVQFTISKCFLPLRQPGGFFSTALLRSACFLLQWTKNRTAG